MTSDVAETRHDLPPWWQALAERAAAPPLRPRRRLCLAGVEAAPIGSIEPELAERLRDAGHALQRRGDDEILAGEPDAALEGIAQWLHAQGFARRWRGELLAVTSLESGTAPRARIERSAVRPLGIATHAVHLIATTPQGEVWSQQRAFDKATDPGQWDTLVGGLVAADEGDAEALERETWEEAGLHLADLQDLRRVDRLTIRRPVSEGYMVEHVDVFEADVPDGKTPCNQDGEVERFERIGPAALVRRLQAGQFTLEAALMTAASLRRRGLL